MEFIKRQHIPSLIAIVIALNGLVNLATGMAPFFKLGVVQEQLESMTEYIQFSTGQRLSSLLSFAFGLVLIGLGKGLYERRRNAWVGALVVLTFLLVNNIYRWSSPHTAILTAVLILGLILLRRYFDVRPEDGFDLGQALALVTVLVALAYGIGGTYVLKDEFSGIENWTDAIYFTFVTYSTLGYGDLLPQTSNAKLFVISMILIGLTSFVTALTVVVGPLIEKRLRGVLHLMSRYQKFVDHVVVCGYSNVSESIIDELQDRNVPYIVIEESEDIVHLLQTKGHDLLNGDATRTEVLAQANLEDAQALIAASDSDSVNTLVGITAKEYREVRGAQFRIVVRVEDEENIEKVKHIGVDEVISPSTMAGRLMAQRAMGQ